MEVSNRTALPIRYQPQKVSRSHSRALSLSSLSTRSCSTISFWQLWSGPALQSPPEFSSSPNSVSCTPCSWHGWHPCIRLACQSRPDLPSGASVPRRSFSQHVGGALEGEGSGSVGAIDKTSSTSPLLYAMVPGEDVKGQSVGQASEVGQPDAGSGNSAQGARAGSRGDAVDAAGRGGLMMGQDMQDSEDLPIDVEDLYGAYY